MIGFVDSIIRNKELEDMFMLIAAISYEFHVRPSVVLNSSIEDLLFDIKMMEIFRRRFRRAIEP